MRINISAWAIRKPIPTLVLFFVLTTLGLVSFRDLSVTRMPNVDVPIVSVSIRHPGSAPAELQTQVTKWVEDSIAGVRGVKHISSAVTEGSSATTVEFYLEVNPDRAVNDVKDAISKVRNDLPHTIEEPTVSRIESRGLPILVYAVRAPAMSPAELSWFVEDDVARAVQGVDGVGNVERLGGVSREIRVSLKLDRLLALGITAADVNTQLRLTSADGAGGRAELGRAEQSIRTLGSARSISELKAISIALPAGRKVRLGDLADVNDTAEEPRTFARFNGEPVVAFAVYRGSGASDADIADGVEKQIRAFRIRSPDVSFEKVDSSVAATVGSYVSAMHTLAEGAALAVIVVFLFLRDWRATVMAAVALPLSVLPTFWAMNMLGFTLNSVSLLAITLVTGILVDDAIVEIENIVRHIRAGKPPYRAALDGADEIGLAVIAITATLIAVFIPVSFMSGIAGRYFVQFGLTIAISVFMSLLVARLITPMLAAFFLRDQQKIERDGDGYIMRVYAAVLVWCLRHRMTTLVIGLLLFSASLAGTILLPSGFLPRQDDGRTLFMLELPPGATLRDTIEVSDRLVHRLMALPHVQSIFTDGGRQTGGKHETRLATLTINLTPKNDRSMKQVEIERQISAVMENEPDIRSWKLRDSGQRDLSLVVAGARLEDVTEVADRLKRDISAIPHLTAVMSTAPLSRTEVRVIPRSGIAAELGVSTDTIAETVRVATIGDAASNLAKYTVEGRQIPIRVQLAQSTRTTTTNIEALRVPAKDGVSVPLAAVAAIELNQGPSAIDRYDRKVRVTVDASIDDSEALGSLVKAVMATATVRDLPPGITIRQSGDAEIMEEVFHGFLFAIGTGIMMVYAVLVLLFGSFLQPFTILFSLPFSIGGAVLGLLIMDMPISMPVVIGILMLMGLVTKNAIMLVDFAVEARRRGIDRETAILDAGRKRARPILMTTVAMVAGMAPSAMSLGTGGEFRAPMAVAVMSGLMVATILSLILVPSIYLLVDTLSHKLTRILGHLVSGRNGNEATGHLPS